MSSTVISVFEYKGHAVRFAFDEDEAYIFVEDGKKLEHLFVEDDPTLVFDPVSTKTISIGTSGGNLQDHKVAPMKTKLFAQCNHYPKAEEWFHFTIWLHKVVWQAHREYQHQIQKTAVLEPKYPDVPTSGRATAEAIDAPPGA
jgi:hypothetical protein